jgi:hypothetical protein
VGDSVRSHWLTVKLETSRGNRSIKLSDFFYFISQPFPICHHHQQQQPVRKKREEEEISLLRKV